LKETNRLHESEAVFRETLSHFPNNAYALIGLASVLRLTRKKDDLTEAFDLIERARSIAPSNAEVLLEQARLSDRVPLPPAPQTGLGEATSFHPGALIGRRKFCLTGGNGK
jgi:hypothetical protein